MDYNTEDMIKKLEECGKQVEATFYEYQKDTKKVLTGSHYKLDLETYELVSTSSTRLSYDDLYENLYDDIGTGAISRKIVFSKPKLILPRVRELNSEYSGSYEASPIVMADGKQIINYHIGDKTLGVQIPYGWSAIVNDTYRIVELECDDPEKRIGKTSRMVIHFFIRNHKAYISCTEYDDLGSHIKTISGNSTVFYHLDDLDNDMIRTREAAIEFNDSKRPFRIVYDESYFKNKSMLFIEDMYLERELGGNVYQDKISIRNRIDGHENLVYPLYTAPEDPEYLTMFDIRKGYLPDYFMKESLTRFDKSKSKYEKYGAYDYYERIIYKVPEEFKREFAHFTEIDKKLE